MQVASTDADLSLDDFAVVVDRDAEPVRSRRGPPRFRRGTTIARLVQRATGRSRMICAPQNCRSYSPQRQSPPGRSARPRPTRLHGFCGQRLRVTMPASRRPVDDRHPPENGGVSPELAKEWGIDVRKVLHWIKSGGVEGDQHRYLPGRPTQVCHRPSRYCCV